MTARTREGHAGRRRASRSGAWSHVQRLVGRGCLVALAALGVVACDEAVSPTPPKSANQPPETALLLESDSLAPVLYTVPLRWFGSDADGKVTAYRLRWTCVDLTVGTCPPDPGWTTTMATTDTFSLYVPGGTGTYVFEVAAVDDDGLADPTPATQRFTLYNHPPVVHFAPGSLPASTLPAITFYLQAVDPDTTALPDDRDSQRGLWQFRAWLDGHEDAAQYVPFTDGAVTFGPDDFQGRYGGRTVYVQVLDDGGAVSTAIYHPWEVVPPPVDGILLVDDCRMGGGLETRSDQSYRNVLEAGAPGRYVVLDIETVPRLSTPDLEATLSLFDRVVWYTDADTVSSGALQLARGGLEALIARNGRLFLSSGLAFGTRAAFGDREPQFRDFFGIDSLFRAANGSTNFVISTRDSVRAAVDPGLVQFRFVNPGLRGIMECFASRRDGATRSLYFYPESTLVRTIADSLPPYVNPVQYDIGVHHQLPGGALTVYVSFPIGLPINTNTGENEIEIREMLRLARILEP
jgi:hypothetical protein